MGNGSHSSTRSRLLAAALVACSFAHAASQEPTPSTQGTGRAITSVTALEEMIATAESCLNRGDKVGAREACSVALAAAQSHLADQTFLAASEQALTRLGATASRAGSVRTAHDAWQAVHRHREATLPDDHEDLDAARWHLAQAKSELGDLRGALVLQEQVLAARTRRLPDDHLELQVARGNLGSSKRELGDLKGALALHEKAFDVLSRVLPDDSRRCRRATLHLAYIAQAAASRRCVRRSTPPAPASSWRRCGKSTTPRLRS